VSLGLFALLGAVGGSLRAVLDLYTQITVWQTVRRRYRMENSSRARRQPPPPLSNFIDVVPEAIAGVVHMGLGATAGMLFGGTGQIAGVYAAILVGASAPALLMQLGHVKSIKDAVVGTSVTEGGEPPGISGTRPSSGLREASEGRPRRTTRSPVNKAGNAGFSRRPESAGEDAADGS
jgi:hypothetical protein